MTNISRQLFSAQQVRDNEPLAAHEIGVPMYDLMESAGQAVFNHIFEVKNKPTHILVLAGAGNNGGDAYVVARLAKIADIKVTLVAFGGIADSHSDAFQAYQKWVDVGGKTTPWQTELLDKCDVVIDGVFGTGLNRLVTPDIQNIFTAVNRTKIPVVSIDIPSGLAADTGQVMGVAIQARTTITFVGIKQGLVTGLGKQYSGQVVFDDLGISPVFCEKVNALGTIIDWHDIPKLAKREISTHKGKCGRILCIGGFMPGAISLSAQAAFRCGAGLVRVYCPASERQTINLSMLELMVCDDLLTERLAWSDVVVLGPGLGQAGWSHETFLQAMAFLLDNPKPLVLDADGVNLLAQYYADFDGAKLNTLLQHAILTPHPKEAGVLLGLSAQQVEADRYESATRIAKMFNCAVILKGAGSIVASFKSEQVAVCENGNPGMATAGMGDILAGICATALVQHLDALDAAKYAVCLHAHAGDCSAREGGERGMIASDLFNYLRLLVNQD